MLRNETIWELAGIERIPETLAAIRDALRSQGWRGGGGPEDAELTDFVRLTQGTKVVEVFHPRQDRHRMRTSIVVRQGEVAPTPSPTTDLYVRYRDRITNGELDEVFTRLLDSDPVDIEFLLAMRRYASSPVRQWIVAHAEAHPPQAAAAWLALALAHLYAGRKDLQAATRALNRVHLLAYAIYDQNDLRKQIKGLVKKHSLDLNEIEQNDFSVFEELGYVWLTPGAAQHLDLSPGQTAKFLVSKVDDDFAVAVVHVDWADQAPDPPTYVVTTMQNGPDQGRSLSRSSGEQLRLPRKRRITLGGRSVELEISASDDVIRVTAALAS